MLLTTKIATLGPAQTFSDFAAKQYLEETNNKYEIHYTPNIQKVFKAILSDECDYGVVPIENLTEGHVQVALDLLVPSNLQIIYELILPIQFSFVSNTDAKNIEKIFTQFVTRGQCNDFLEDYNHCDISTTQSNIESLDALLNSEEKAGAIVPLHVIDSHPSLNVIASNISDSKINQTRFFVLGKCIETSNDSENYKTSIVIFNSKDRSGMLSDILNIISDNHINITSIISRPTREEFGKYHFFIDIDGNLNNLTVKNAINDIQKNHKVKILGCYPKAKQIESKKS